MSEHLSDTNVGNIGYASKQEIFDALEKVASFFPYKIPGNADTYDKYNEAWNDAIGRAEMEIESIEPADVAPVVRCKNCIYSAKSRGHQGKYMCNNESAIDDYVKLDDFCSYGERRGNDVEKYD